MVASKAKPFTIRAYASRYKKWLYPGGWLRIPIATYALIIVAQVMIVTRRWHSGPTDAAATVLILSIVILGIVIIVNSPRQTVSLTESHLIHRGPLWTSRYSFKSIHEVIYVKSYQMKHDNSTYARIFIVRSFWRRTSLQQVFINSAYFRSQDIKQLATRLAARSPAKLRVYAELDTTRLAELNPRALSVLEKNPYLLALQLLVCLAGFYVLIFLVLAQVY